MDAALPFLDREDAAQQLAGALARYREARPVVLAIPRGAVPMGRIVANALDGDLDVILVRKLGAPGNPEYAIGAIDERGQVLLDESSFDRSGASEGYLQQEAQRQLALIRERRRLYCGDRPGIALTGRTVIVIDDGLATGATMRAALRAARAQRPARLVCAVPVGARESVEQVARIADDVVCLATPSPFDAVGFHYRSFDQVDDDAVAKALHTTQGSPTCTEASSYPARIRSGQVTLDGELASPAWPRGLVIFAHGSGDRPTARNRLVAEALTRKGFATLLFNLLTPQEERDRAASFDIPLLARRLQAAVDWACLESGHCRLPIILFGASTAAAAALALAAARPGEVTAVISSGGLPDLAGPDVLAKVRAPTLLIVGGADPEELRHNRDAKAVLGGKAQLVVVPDGKGPLEGPGAQEAVATLATGWVATTVAAAWPDAHRA